MSISQGLFITVEGGEGVGKSSFCRNLSSWVEQNFCLKERPLLTHEPGGTRLAQSIRQLFLTPPGGESINALTELFLISAARSDHLEKKIGPALRGGEWVICDRFYDSTRVYQGIMSHIEMNKLERILDLSVNERHPDITFLLDCETRVALERLRLRHKEDADSKTRFDAASESYHERLREAFLQVARSYPQRFHILNAASTPEEILEEASAVIKNRLKNSGTL